MTTKTAHPDTYVGEVSFRKIGNSLGMIIPKLVVDDLAAKDGSVAILRLIDGQLIVELKKSSRLPKRKPLSWYYAKLKKDTVPDVNEVFPDDRLRGGELL